MWTACEYQTEIYGKNYRGNFVITQFTTANNAGNSINC
uniref:Uncharacterized protein n=1 Tax=Arundo donax TaxID=35708 RepID=A0A0A8YQ32_ARUDO